MSGRSERHERRHMNGWWCKWEGRRRRTFVAVWVKISIVDAPLRGRGGRGGRVWATLCSHAATPVPTYALCTMVLTRRASGFWSIDDRALELADRTSNKCCFEPCNVPTLVGPSGSSECQPQGQALEESRCLIQRRSSVDGTGKVPASAPDV